MGLRGHVKEAMPLKEPAKIPLAEKDFQKQVLDLARTYHWLVFHVYDSRLATGTGYPDVCMSRQGRILYVELKTERGRLSAKQKEWLDALSLCPSVETYTWKPHDIEEIKRILR